jgi:hypothetical protein
MTYSLGKFTFPSKRAAIERIKKILSSAPLRQPLVGEDARLILALLLLHPRWEQKVHDDIVGLSVATDKNDVGFCGRSFQIIHRGGSLTHFSYRVALGLKAPAEERFEEACRYAVNDSTWSFKRTLFNSRAEVYCALTGAPLTFESSVLHHCEPWPFKRIVSEFVEAYGTPAIRKRTTGAFGMEFVNEADATRFREFHDARAVLPLVSRDAHSRLRHAQLTALAAENSDNGECAGSDLF